MISHRPDKLHVKVSAKCPNCLQREIHVRSSTGMCLLVDALRQCSGEKSIFFNNATNELLFGRKHCFYDLNIKMVHFCTFIMRLLWKLGKIAAILDSRRRKKRSQFWIFCYQIFNISKKLQYLQTYQRDFWNFEKKSIFLIFCQKWHKNMRFFIVFRIPFRN